MIMKNDYSKRSMPLNWGVSKSLTTSRLAAVEMPQAQKIDDELISQNQSRSRSLGKYNPVKVASSDSQKLAIDR